MKIFKTYKQFILEQDGLDIRAAVNSAPTKVVTKPDAAPAAKTTEPDPVVMDKLQKLANHQLAYIFSDNETKPEQQNGVSVEVKGTGRTYNFRSKPQTVIVYKNSQEADNVAYRGTYKITDTQISTKSTDEKISETIDIANGKLAINPTTKQPISNLPSNETADQKQKSVAQTVAAAINANSGAFTDANEEVVFNAAEAALYWISKNKLTPDQSKEFLKVAFAKGESLMRGMEMDSWDSFLYLVDMPTKPLMTRLLNWDIVWQPERDEDNKYLASKVPSRNSIGSYEPMGKEARKWAETIWNIIDDLWVSVDEEINAMVAILALSPKGLINVEAEWRDLQELGIIDVKLDIVDAIKDAVDSDDAGELLKRFSNAIKGTPSEGAKKMIELS